MLEKKFVRALLCLVVVLSFSATATMGADILFIVNDPTLTTYPNDALIGDFLESLGHMITYFDDNEDEAAMEAAAAAADMVYISESVGSSNVANKITEIEVPIVVGEPYCWDEMGMTSGGGSTSDVATTDIETKGLCPRSCSRYRPQQNLQRSSQPFRLPVHLPGTA